MSTDNPLTSRYASQEMQRIFSADTKYRTWRKLWIALAEAQSELGLDISESQLDELRKNADTIDLEAAAEIEKEVRHDVMAHVRLYAQQCPSAGAKIHLGATSAFVTDNTELIQLRDGLQLVERRLAVAVDRLASFARRHRNLATLGYTHLQPAQLTTVGKRACLWLQDLLLDAEALEFELGRLKLRGAKGTTGTQASYLELFGGDARKVEELDHLVTQKLGFKASFDITGQTYPRKIDAAILAVLGGIAASASKFATDVRLLMGFGQLEEPIKSGQIGSSAMAYKRNPVQAERICSLARLVIAGFGVAAGNASNQWLERSLDDSANRRLLLSEAFMTTDAILILVGSVASGLSVFETGISEAVARELPYQATETILMEAVKRGGDRQALHERIRQLSFDVTSQVRRSGPNDLLDRIAADPIFKMDRSIVAELCDPARFVGRAPAQVDKFLAETVEPFLRRFPEAGDDQQSEPRV